MKKTTMTELETKQGVVEDFNGESHSYAGLIRTTVQDLKNTNDAISKEIKETEALVAAYNANIANLKSIMNENSRIIEEISKVFEGETE